VRRPFTLNPILLPETNITGGFRRTAMTTTDLPARQRREIEALLPWHATGVLNACDAERVAAMLAGDSELSRDTIWCARSWARPFASTRRSALRRYAPRSA